MSVKKSVKKEFLKETSVIEFVERGSGRSNELFYQLTTEASLATWDDELKEQQQLSFENTIINKRNNNENKFSTKEFLELCSSPKSNGNKVVRNKESNIKKKKKKVQIFEENSLKSQNEKQVSLKKMEKCNYLFDEKLLIDDIDDNMKENVMINNNINDSMKPMEYFDWNNIVRSEQDRWGGDDIDEVIRPPLHYTSAKYESPQVIPSVNLFTIDSIRSNKFTPNRYESFVDSDDEGVPIDIFNSHDSVKSPKSPSLQSIRATQLNDSSYYIQPEALQSYSNDAINEVVFTQSMDKSDDIKVVVDPIIAAAKELSLMNYLYGDNIFNSRKIHADKFNIESISAVLNQSDSRSSEKESPLVKLANRPLELDMNSKLPDYDAYMFSSGHHSVVKTPTTTNELNLNYYNTLYEKNDTSSKFGRELLFSPPTTSITDETTVNDGQVVNKLLFSPEMDIIMEGRANEVIQQSKSIYEELTNLRITSNPTMSSKESNNTSETINEEMKVSNLEYLNTLDRKTHLISQLNHKKLVSLVIELQEELEKKDKIIAELQAFIMDEDS